MKMKFLFFIYCVLFFSMHGNVAAQVTSTYKDSVVVRSHHYRLVIDRNTGSVNSYFEDGSYLKNITASIKEISGEIYNSSEFKRHTVYVISLADKIGQGQQLRILHEQDGSSVQMLHTLNIYKDKPFFLLGLEIRSVSGQSLEVNYISPLVLSKQYAGTGYVKGNEPRILDMPFDNDNWTKLLTVGWGAGQVRGTGYNFSSLYDRDLLSGVVVGSVSHDFWKTGIHYVLSEKKNVIDSFAVYGGAAVPDNKRLRAEFGGNDGTHDVVAHGPMKGQTVVGPQIFVCGLKSRTEAFRVYGWANAALHGSLPWHKSAPFYWNSFGVEGVLGYEKQMMPDEVMGISDFIASLKNFSKDKKIYISIDSYDQGIYTEDVLKSIRQHCVQNGQEVGFYFIPFAVWTWKSSVNKDKLQYTNYNIRDVTLKDSSGHTIVYKDGDFGAFPLDPTHPATRERILGELKKARAVAARFLKIDFLTAGALESTTRYDRTVRSGLQAYHSGMKMLKHLIDSMLGPDIFITQAISPIFPSQFAHVRFLSTDVYSHLRNDLPPFPHYGSTASSMITSSHLGWMQGSLWPFTNMDIVVMHQFQKHPPISDQDVKVRLITMAIMGSILGDGSDFEDSTARERAYYYLNNPNLCKYFDRPRAFLPLKVADGLTEDQQLSFYSPGKTIFAAIVNFDTTKSFRYTFEKDKLKWPNKSYLIRDFLTHEKLTQINAGDNSFQLTAAPKDAIWVELVEL
ncbi:hypothetical protein ABDK00_010370 [Niabella insulamsoli]|uniref:hypothetical protein n=1 Tax=Niabella insulamsoli TaxID=3144874 RepID=UPI0031FCF438